VQETCGTEPLFQEEWASAHFFYDVLTVMTDIQAHEQSGSDRESVVADVEVRLEALGPDVEVLLVELTTLRGAPAVRVFLDRPGGVDHELCVRATDQLRDLLREYAVEVSSPGPARPLTKPEHYRRFVGRRVRVRTRDEIAGRREFKGELLAADDDEVALASDGGTITIPHERIRRANLVPQPTPLPRRRR
jgi:ribosome maturation factor RimP